MRNPRIAARPGVEALDRRELLSGLLPTLTMNRLGVVAHSVRNVMGTLARTNDFDGAARRLSALAPGIPFGRRDLAPAWRGSLDSIDRSIPGSGRAAQDQMIRDLYQVVYAQVQDRTIRLVGDGAEAFTEAPPSNAPNYESVQIVNLTGRQIVATAFLNVTRSGQRPIIGPRPISPDEGKNSFLFDFGPKAPPSRSISLEINATPTIQRFREQALTEPYGGAAFYVTTLGEYFVVSRQPPPAVS